MINGQLGKTVKLANQKSLYNLYRGMQELPQFCLPGNSLSLSNLVNWARMSEDQESIRSSNSKAKWDAWTGIPRQTGGNKLGY